MPVTTMVRVSMAVIVAPSGTGVALHVPLGSSPFDLDLAPVPSWSARRIAVTRIYNQQPGQSRCAPVPRAGEDRAHAGSCPPSPASEPRVGRCRPRRPPAARAADQPASDPAGVTGYRLGRVRRHQPGRHAPDPGLADGAVPGHLGAPDRDLRVPAGATPAHHLA